LSDRNIGADRIRINRAVLALIPEIANHNGGRGFMVEAPSNKLAIGNEVCLRLEELHPKGRMEIPHGDVTRIKDDGIYIHIPVIEGKYLEGRRVEILWEKGASLYCLSTTIRKCFQDRDTVLVVSPSKQLRSINKRRYFRLESPIHLEFKPKECQGLFISAEGKDLSGGGVRFLTEYPLTQGQVLDMLIEVPIFPYLDISVIGEVVRLERLKGKEGIQVGVNFTDIEPIGRKRLLKYILDEMQPLKKRKDEAMDVRYWFSLS